MGSRARFGRPYGTAKLGDPGWIGAVAGTEQGAEKLWIWGVNSEKHTSVAEAGIDSIELVPGINPRPTARMSFSAACEARTLQAEAAPWEICGFPPLRQKKGARMGHGGH